MKKFLTGFLVGAMIFSTVGAYAAGGGKTIEVFENVKDIKIDLISQEMDKKPFVYEGTTYVPLRFISEKLNVPVKWEGSTQTIYLGETGEESATYLGDGIKYLTYQESHGSSYAKVVYDREATLYATNSDITTINNNIGDTYSKFLYLGHDTYYDASEGDWNYVTYPTNGQYERFKSTISLSENTKNTETEVELKIYADNNVVYSKKVEAGFLPEEIDVDINNAIKVKFELTVTKEGNDNETTVILGNPRFIK